MKKSWRKYWCVLKNTDLHCFESNLAPYPVETIQFNNVTIKESINLSKDHCFSIVFGDQKILQFAAISYDEREIWIEKIKQSCSLYWVHEVVLKKKRNSWENVSSFRRSKNGSKKEIDKNISPENNGLKKGDSMYIRHKKEPLAKDKDHKDHIASLISELKQKQQQKTQRPWIPPKESKPKVK